MLKSFNAKLRQKFQTAHYFSFNLSKFHFFINVLIIHYMSVFIILFTTQLRAKM